MERLFNQAIVNVEKEIDLIPLVSVNKKTQQLYIKNLKIRPTAPFLPITKTQNVEVPA